MYAIRPASEGDRDAVVDLILRQQADPTRHIGYHGVTIEDVVDELGGIKPDWAGGAVVGVGDSGEIVAVLSADADAEVGRVWLLGPYVELPADHPVPRQVWHRTADDLLDAVTGLPRLRGFADLELYGHRKHSLLADFAARHGFAGGDMSRVFTLSGSALRSLLIREAGGEEPRVLTREDPARAEVIDLHERAFPSRTATGRQLVDGDRGHTVVVLTGADGLIGYAAGFPQPGEFYVDYVAVVPGMRSAGAGRAVVRGLLRELAAQHGPHERAAAVIMLGNDASERMFTALGFALHLELVGYRRKGTA
ncbi:GNAT family N-acetyltransferase [Actinokineospora guangxiensis]|uniref:GNAT family N-acetyltransferase n=1 Tax=Actinokineospora guangxiensis TaxID=1490288 RepID=A0ABW0EX99_9PSEU